MGDRQGPEAVIASVVVPVHDGAKTLGACLAALAAQTVEADSYEVIVVDDGSEDGSAALAAGHGVMVVRQDHAGAATARNLGVQQARGAILLFTDADCEPQADWIERMLASLKDPEVAGVKGVYRTRQASLVARFVQAELEEKYDRLARGKEIDFVDTYAAAYRREAFVARGGFDPDFLGDEDQEFSFRMSGAGHRLIFAPVAVVYHRHPTSVWYYLWRRVHSARWKVRVLARHPTKAVRDSYTPWTQKAQIVLLPLTGAAAIGALAGVLPWILAGLLAVCGLATAIPVTIKAAHQGWRVALAAPPLLLLRAAALCLGLAWGVASLLGAPNRDRDGRQP